MPLDVREAVDMALAVDEMDRVDLEDRAARRAARSPGSQDDRSALELAIRCVDLTRLDGDETPSQIEALCARAVSPDPTQAHVPSVAAVCLHARWVPVALEALGGTGVAVACVAGGFPFGNGPLDARLEEIRDAAEAGADEIDIVLNREPFLGERYVETFEELVAARQAAGSALLKVILETGALESFARIRRASMLAMAAGADFIKTSTGKVEVGATLPAALCMEEAARDFFSQTGRAVGIKVAGGIRTSKQALQHLAVLEATLGSDWLMPRRFRIGASSLLESLSSALLTLELSP